MLPSKEHALTESGIAALRRSDPHTARSVFGRVVAAGHADATTHLALALEPRHFRAPLLKADIFHQAGNGPAAGPLATHVGCIGRRATDHHARALALDPVFVAAPGRPHTARHRKLEHAPDLSLALDRPAALWVSRRQRDTGVVEGKACVFDDTIEHGARNLSDQTRVILLFEVWQPDLTLVERDLVGAIFEAIDSDRGVRAEWTI